jgi:hypothetical protein
VFQSHLIFEDSLCHKSLLKHCQTLMRRPFEVKVSFQGFSSKVYSGRQKLLPMQDINKTFFI